MKLNDFGLLLTSAINNTNPIAKQEIIAISEKQKSLNMKNIETENKKNEYYMNTYQYKRENNRIIYDEYVAKRRVLYQKWSDSNKIGDLQQLVSYKLPDTIEIIEDIYTRDIKKSKLKSNKKKD